VRLKHFDWYRSKTPKKSKFVLFERHVINESG